jgi:hypothetical protein
MGCNCRGSISRQPERLVDMMRSSFSQQVTSSSSKNKASASASARGSVQCPKCGQYRSPITNSLVRCPIAGCNTVFAATTANAR